jgi:hypothetical protein
MHLETGPGEFFTAFPGDGVVFVVNVVIAFFAGWVTKDLIVERRFYSALFPLTATLALIGSLLWFVTGSVSFTHTFGTMDSPTLPILQISVFAFCAALLSLTILVVWSVVIRISALRRRLRRRG